MKKSFASILLFFFCISYSLEIFGQPVDSIDVNLYNSEHEQHNTMVIENHHDRFYAVLTSNRALSLLMKTDSLKMFSHTNFGMKEEDTQ